MHEAVSEAVLPNDFPKIARLHPENCSWSCFLKNTFTQYRMIKDKKILNRKLVCTTDCSWFTWLPNVQSRVLHVSSPSNKVAAVSPLWVAAPLLVCLLRRCIYIVVPYALTICYVIFGVPFVYTRSSSRYSSSPVSTSSQLLSLYLVPGPLPLGKCVRLDYSPLG
jgi:hypothetical protein